jgi:hypothetical protein
MAKVEFHGKLVINPEEGTAQFLQYGIVMLNITHLPTPVPLRKGIELVALPALTSYVDRDWNSLDNLDVKGRELFGTFGRYSG